MFEEFSAGYYIGRLCVATYDGDHAAMKRTKRRTSRYTTPATASDGRIGHFSRR